MLCIPCYSSKICKLLLSSSHILPLLVSLVSPVSLVSLVSPGEGRGIGAKRGEGQGGGKRGKRGDGRGMGEGGERGKREEGRGDSNLFFLFSFFLVNVTIFRTSFLHVHLFSLLCCYC